MDEKVYELAQARTDAAIADGIKAVVTKPARESATHCEDCDVKIPEARRTAVPGVQRCAPCQEIAEQKQKHYR